MFFTAALAVAGVLNWATTCCCGHSTVLELLEGSCQPHDDNDSHHAAGHQDGDSFPCHKGSGAQFLLDSRPAPNQSTPIVLASFSLNAVQTNGLFIALPAAGQATGMTVHGGVSPDIPILIQRLLI